PSDGNTASPWEPLGPWSLVVGLFEKKENSTHPMLAFIYSYFRVFTPEIPRGLLETVLQSFSKLK
ncbi:hypothetical protein AVEN_252629-1, partial [Araneus ventricosus]